MGTNQRKRKSNRRQAIAVIVFILLAALGFNLLVTRVSEAKYLKAHFVNPDGKSSSKFKLEVVSTPTERAKGLMFRKEMDEDVGMLFVFPGMRDQGFWMKDTLISLDMLFLDADRKVVGILHSVPIMNEKRRSVKKPSMYVIELVAGTAKKQGIVEGSRFIAEGEVPAGL